MRYDFPNIQLHEQVVGSVEVALGQTDTDRKLDTDRDRAPLGVCRDLYFTTFVQDMRSRYGCGKAENSCQSSDRIDTHPESSLW